MTKSSVLRCGDCLELLAEIPDGGIDLLVTDPPYCIGTTSNGMKGNWSDNNLIRPFFTVFFREVALVLKDGAAFYINTDWRTYPFLFPLVAERLTVRNCIVWDYEWIKAGAFYRFRHEWIMFGTKGESARAFPASEADVWRIKTASFDKDKQHQAQKPLALVEKMILNSSRPGDVVLDTFAGSGTTAVACKKTGRRFIGFEIDPATFAVACARIGRETRQEYMF